MTVSAYNDAIDYFSAFRASHLDEYFEAMREYRVGGNSGYQHFIGSDCVVQTMIDIHGNLEETFADLSVPKGFVTPKTRTDSFTRFLDMLKKRGIEFEEISIQLVKDGRAKNKHLGDEWDDSDFIPEPFKQIDRIRLEVIAALEFTIQLEEKSGAFEQPSEEQLKKLLRGFHRFIVQLGKRHSSRETLTVNDEYDVQDALHSLLKLHFEDVRAEEYTPSYAGGASRIDFLLDNDQILIEVKMTRKSLKDKSIGDQVAVDIIRYQSHPKCKKVYFFIYDPRHLLNNPSGLIRDLTKTIDRIEYHTIIAPPL